VFRAGLRTCRADQLPAPRRMAPPHRLRRRARDAIRLKPRTRPLTRLFPVRRLHPPPPLLCPTISAGRPSPPRPGHFLAPPSSPPSRSRFTELHRRRAGALPRTGQGHAVGSAQRGRCRPAKATSRPSKVGSSPGCCPPAKSGRRRPGIRPPVRPPGPRTTLQRSRSFKDCFRKPGTSA
jgi:hypothetical protein